MYVLLAYPLMDTAVVECSVMARPTEPLARSALLFRRQVGLSELDFGRPIDALWLVQRTLEQLVQEWRQTGVDGG